MKLLDFIVCDDIRQERGDKLSFMGVFADCVKLQVPQGAPRPIAFRMGIFLRMLLEEADPLPDRFKIVLKLSNDEVAAFEGKIAVKGRPRLMGFPLPLSAVPIADNTSLNFHASIFAGERLLLETEAPYDVGIEIVEIETIQLAGHEQPPEVKTGT
jgi:hypothetical protein